LSELDDEMDGDRVEASRSSISLASVGNCKRPVEGPQFVHLRGVDGLEEGREWPSSARRRVTLRALAVTDLPNLKYSYQAGRGRTTEKVGFGMDL